ncbi:unnamed protein product [Parnassius apollo]|uniref:(apollo) hypothetical protein n=1 Tax=Parnassius apollo TaxID=110799 RepID=A0A8S3WS25_PARAO|nr:unnamed protein product [Parnassius apollo]
MTLHNILEECKKRESTSSLLVNYSKYKEYLDDFSVFHIMLKYYKQFKDIGVCFDSFKIYSANLVTNELVHEIERATKNQVYSVLWHSLRQGRITASNIYNTINCTTANGVLVKTIVGAYKVPETLENLVKKEVEVELDVEVKDCGFVLVSGIIGASPDGITDNYVVEVKCPSKESSIKSM